MPMRWFEIKSDFVSSPVQPFRKRRVSRSRRPKIKERKDGNLFADTFSTLFLHTRYLCCWRMFPNNSPPETKMWLFGPSKKRKGEKERSLERQFECANRLCGRESSHAAGPGHHLSTVNYKCLQFLLRSIWIFSKNNETGNLLRKKVFHVRSQPKIGSDGQECLCVRREDERECGRTSRTARRGVKINKNVNLIYVQFQITKK